MVDSAPDPWGNGGTPDKQATTRPWRCGTKPYANSDHHRTIYVQWGDEPNQADPMIGVMDTPELAAIVVQAVNQMHGLTPPQ